MGGTSCLHPLIRRNYFLISEVILGRVPTLVYRLDIDGLTTEEAGHTVPYIIEEVLDLKNKTLPVSLC